MAAAGILILTTYVLARRPLAQLRLIAAGEDEDIKIAEGPFRKGPVQEDLAEQAARQFLKQKNAGNIEKARRLGQVYADAIIGFEKEPPGNCRAGRTQLEVHHQLLLCSYVINRVVAEYSPNSILAQTTLNVFYSALEEASPSLRQHVSDMAAFSLYILCERSRMRTEQDIGETYARLCGFEGQAEQIREGNQIYRDFNQYCVDQMEKAAYAPLEE